MKWSTIRQKHPNKFILLGDLIEEPISTTQSQIVEGKILAVSDSGKEIRQKYRKYKNEGINVLYALPTTPPEFIVENVPLKGILR